MSLSVRIVASVLLAMAVMMAVIGSMTVSGERAFLERQFLEHGRAKAEILASFAVEHLLVEDYPILESTIKAIGVKAPLIKAVEIRVQDQVVAAYASPPQTAARLFEVPVTIRPTEDSPPRALGTVRLWLSEDANRDAASRRTQLLVLYFAAAGLTVALMLAWLLNSLILGRLGRLTRAVVDLETGELTPAALSKLPGSKGHSDEIDILASRFRTLLKALQNYQTNLQNLVAEQTRTLSDISAFNRKIIDSSPVGVAIYDRRGNCLTANQSLADIIGTTRQYVLGRNYHDIESWTKWGLHEIAARALAERRHLRREVTLETAAGKSVSLDCHFVPMTGKDTDLLFMANDITVQKAVEADLERARDDAQAANRAKSRFLAAASHDLRQPLQAMSLYAASLGLSLDKEGPVDKRKVGEILNHLTQSIDNLSVLLNSLLDVSKFDTGRVQPNVMEFPVRQILNDLSVGFSAPAHKKGLDFTVVQSRAYISSDPILLKRVCDNLVSNAVRYTDSGRILIGCRRHKDALRIEILDTGLGIAENNLNTIFDEFLQLNNPARQSELGQGLGLSIAKRIADLLGHRILVRSTPGKGSAFCVEIPLAPEREAVPPPARRASSHGKRGFDKTVLVIDDDPDALDALLGFLQSIGYRAMGANGHDAVLALPPEELARVDVVVADYQLGGSKNGLELVQDVQKRTGRVLPAIIVSGATTRDAQQAFADSGLVHLIKPVEPGTLQDQIAALTGPP
ncbi:MAG: PAS domain S-box protein [Alphaproteobacteria bacterium]|nr:PAS domain S-box protein [Alphaproteobacteria bacterium]